MGCSASQTSLPNTGEIGQDFHDKHILGIALGRGAFAQVRICKKVSHSLRPEGTQAAAKERAVKILDLRQKEKPEEIDSQVAKNAHKEACVWKQIGYHPFCVELRNVFFGDNLCYMVMEKCNMGLLKALEGMPELTEASLGPMFAQMITAIEHCHSKKVVHRDIKPDNFMIGGEDGATIKLGDFGLSAMMSKEGEKLPGVFGTAPFMCPEMLINRLSDEKGDVWSFAVIVYVLVFGQFPYMPKVPSCKAMKQAIIDGSTAPNFLPIQPKSGMAARPRSPELVAMVQPLLDRDPAKRPSATQALKSRYLQCALNGERCPQGELPSLRPMVHNAKKVGAFEVRDPCRESSVDVLLNQLQMQRHGQALPSGKSSSTSKHGVSKADAGTTRLATPDNCSRPSSVHSDRDRCSDASTSVGDSRSSSDRTSSSALGHRSSMRSKGTMDMPPVRPGIQTAW